MCCHVRYFKSNATATYSLYHRKLTRYNAEERPRDKMVVPDAQLTSSSMSTQVGVIFTQR